MNALIIYIPIKPSATALRKRLFSVKYNTRNNVVKSVKVSSIVSLLSIAEFSQSWHLSLLVQI